MLSNIYFILFFILAIGAMFLYSLKNTSWGFIINFGFIFLLFVISFPTRFDFNLFVLLSFRLFIPLILINVLLSEWLLNPNKDRLIKQYAFRMPLASGSINLKDIRRGVSIIGAAGSGKPKVWLPSF
tara:strand:+ start:280 stop:660 length:381 start_codon:yes stop_codon:yes gene_type:complete